MEGARDAWLRGDRMRAAERYRPARIRTLLVAQSPPKTEPQEPPRYFYFEDVRKHDALFRAVIWSGLGVEPARDAKAALLRLLHDEGVFLIDLKPDPADRRRLVEFVPSLLERCRKLQPDRIILIKADVYDASFGPLKAAGLPVVDARIAFPGSGQQRAFARAFADAMRVARNGLAEPPPARVSPPDYFRYLAVAPADGLYVRAYGHGDDGRFAARVTRVWGAIPDEHRRAMLEHWGRCVSLESGRLGVQLGLENMARMRQTRTVADCAATGTELKCYARVMDLLPDRLAGFVIAHELAHVLQALRGEQLRPNAHPLGEAVAYMLSPVERAADQLASDWGFPGDGLNRWIDYHVDWDGFPADPY